MASDNSRVSVSEGCTAIIHVCSRSVTNNFSAISIQDDVFIAYVNEPSNKNRIMFFSIIKTKVFKMKLQKLAFLVEILVFSC